MRSRDAEDFTRPQAIHKVDRRIRDEDGASPGSTVRLSVPPRGAATFTSFELESGAAAKARPDTEIAPLAVKRSGIAVGGEPNVIVVDTETMGRIHFDLDMLGPEELPKSGHHPSSERLR